MPMAPTPDMAWDQPRTNQTRSTPTATAASPPSPQLLVRKPKGQLRRALHGARRDRPKQTLEHQNQTNRGRQIDHQAPTSIVLVRGTASQQDGS